MAFTSPCRCRCSIHVISRRLNSSCKPRPASATSSHTALDPLPRSASISTPSSSRLGQHTALHTRRIISGSEPSADWTSSGGTSATFLPRPANPGVCRVILGKSPLTASAATRAISRLARPTTSLRLLAIAASCENPNPNPKPRDEDGPKESPEAPMEPEPTPEPPPTPEAAAARFAAMGPMSHAAVELLTRHDVRGVDVDVPALLRAGDEGGAVGLLADPATARWFSRYLVRDLHAMVEV
mmetsp:Transcript_3659/g.14730  ORF Transcript_3659/g.14730 Transcript_3659/m.14730 type:complete len:241 (-) Transcript_3659:78-800(-)